MAAAEEANTNEDLVATVEPVVEPKKLTGAAVGEPKIAAELVDDDTAAMASEAVDTVEGDNVEAKEL